MNIKGTVTIAVTMGLLAGSAPQGTVAQFALRAAEYEATLQGIEGVKGALDAHPDNAQFERAYLGLTAHCTNLAALYNVAAGIIGDDFAAAGLPASLDAAACEVAQ